MKRTFTLIGGLLILALLAGCGPSPEQIATMTASAWTPTPPPTATPTPVPYDVNVSIVDESGAPIAGANIVFPESGNGEPVASDAQGKFSWNNLEGENATFKVAAQGYFPAEQTATLQRGANEVSVTVKRDPFSFLPSTACGTAESLLYMEDFQDGAAQDWGGDDKNAASRYIASAPNEPENSVFVFDATKLILGPDSWLGANYQAGDSSIFGDAVLRMRFMVNRVTAPSFNWHEAGRSEFDGREVIATRYSFNFWGARNQIYLHRTIEEMSGGASDFVAYTGTFTQIPETWHWMEISSYQGYLQLWLDGKMEVEYTDPQPLPNGGIGMWIGPFTDPSTTMVYLDAISVCSLSAPFASMLSPIPAP